MATQIDPSKILLGDFGDEEEPTQAAPEAPAVVEEQDVVIEPQAIAAAEDPPSPAEVLGEYYKTDDEVQEVVEQESVATALPPILDLRQNAEGSYTEPEDAIHWNLSVFGVGCLRCDALVQSADPKDIKYKGTEMPCHWSKGKYKKCPCKWMTIRFTGNVDRLVNKYKALAEPETDPMRRIQKINALNKDLMECTRDEQSQILSQLGLLDALNVRPR